MIKLMIFIFNFFIYSDRYMVHLLHIYSTFHYCRFNLHNLCHHVEDHGINADRSYFATSHGKGACDGLGGTVKRLVTKASLQGQLISTPEAMFDYATVNIPGIK